MLNTLQMPDSAHWIIVGPMSSTEAPLIRNVLIQIHRCKPMPTRTAKAARHPRSLKVSRRSLLPWCRLLIQILDWKSHICQRKMHLPNWSFSKSTTVFFKHIFFWSWQLKCFILFKHVLNSMFLDPFPRSVLKCHIWYSVGSNIYRCALSFRERTSREARALEMTDLGKPE